MNLDWTRLFPDQAHRWRMATHPGDAEKFFAPEDVSGEISRERSLWLKAAAEDYATLSTDGEPLLAEAIELASTWRERPFFGNGETSDPMAVLLELGREWEPDFVFLRPNTAGMFRVVGGVVCFPSSWSLPDKMGLPLSLVHDAVPALNTALAKQIHTFMSKMDPGAAWERENWGLVGDPSRNHHPRRLHRKVGSHATIDKTWVRVERQLLLKLPRTGGVLFGIRVSSHPLQEIVNIPAAAKGLMEVLKTMSPAAADYKGIALGREPLIRALRESGVKD